MGFCIFCLFTSMLKQSHATSSHFSFSLLFTVFCEHHLAFFFIFVVHLSPSEHKSQKENDDDDDEASVKTGFIWWGKSGKIYSTIASWCKRKLCLWIFIVKWSSSEWVEGTNMCRSDSEEPHKMTNDYYLFQLDPISLHCWTIRLFWWTRDKDKTTE